MLCVLCFVAWVLQTLNKIFRSGYSRVPIYDRDRNDVVGLILAKDLLFIDPEDELPMRSFMTVFCRPIQTVWPDDKLNDVSVADEINPNKGVI